MAINPLGRLLNLDTSATTTATPVNLRHCAGALVILIGATSGNATIQEATTSAGAGAQNLAAITEYWRSSAGTWTRVTQAAAATFTAGTGGLAAVWIPGTALSDGYDYITASHASGSFIIAQADLAVQRKPANLPTTR